MKSLRYLIAIAFLLIIATGCEDKYDPANPNLPVGTELIFSSHANIYNVSIGQCDSWVVKSYPKWATPMEESGTRETKMSIFVEDNFSEKERKGEIVVIAGKNEITYSLTQRSTLTEDANEVIKDSILYLTYGVGFGINVLGTPTMGKYDFAGAIVNPALLTRMLAEVGEADAFCAEDHYFSHTESVSGTSTTSLSTQLSVNAGIEAEISGFSGSLSGKFTNNESTNTNTAYAMREIKHIVGSRYLRPGVLRHLSAANKTSVFSDDFNLYVKDIKDDPKDKDAIKYLLEAFGTHLIVHGSLGGELELAMEMTSTETISEMDINAALNLSCGVVDGDASFTMTDDEKKLMKNTKISLKTYGGNNVYTLNPGTTFEEAMKEALDSAKLEGWIASIKDKSSLALVDVQLYPIYDLMPDAETRAAVREYMINEYQKAKTGKKPLLFAVNGFGDNAVITGEAYIPELDIKLECYSEMIPEISSEEPVIMIYSGTKNEMNYNTGFFIGNKTLKPGKLRKNREGKYSFEPFEDLAEGQITELYVNATGDITIAGKPGVAYSEVKFTGITKEDLDRNRISESEDIKEYIQGFDDPDAYEYWYTAEGYKTILALAKGLNDNVLMAINKGVLDLNYTCKPNNAVEFCEMLALAEDGKDVSDKHFNCSGSEVVEWSSPILPQTKYILIYMGMSDDEYEKECSAEDYENERPDIWRWIEKPYLHLSINYDKTPRHRE